MISEVMRRIISALHDGKMSQQAVAHFEDREGLQNFVESLTVAVQGVHGQVGAREQGLRSSRRGEFRSPRRWRIMRMEAGQEQDGRCAAGGALGGGGACRIRRWDAGVEELDVGFVDAPGRGRCGQSVHA